MPTTIIITDDADDHSPGYVHIPYAPTAVNPLITLCGYLDGMDAEESTKPPTCPACIEVLRYCKSLRFRNLPSQS